MKINQLKAGALLSYIFIFITIVIGLVYTPIMIRLIGQTEFGLYSLVGSIAGYFSILDLGLGNAIVRYTARNRAVGDREAEASMNGMFLALYSFLGILTIVLGAAFYINIENIFASSLTLQEIEKAKVMMLLLIFNLAASFMFGTFGSIIQAYEKFVFIKLVDIIRATLTPCITLPFLYAGYGSVLMVAVTTVLNISCLLINVVYCLRILKINIYFKGFDYSLIKEIAGYSFFIFLNVIVDKIYWNTGQFILGVVSGTALVAVYAIAMQLSTMYKMFSTAISSLLLPKVSMMVANNASNDELSQLMIKIGRVQYIIMALILSGFVIFGQDFITLWAGPSYIDAYPIVLIIMIPLTIPLIQNIGISILQAKNMLGFRSVVYVAIAVLNVLVSIPLAKMWGGFGCALATGLSLLFGNVIIMNIYYNRRIGLNIPLFWRNIIRMTMPVLVVLLFGYGINNLVGQSSIFLLACNIVLYTIIYVVIMWFFGLNMYEKELFMSPVKKIINKCLLSRD